MFALLTKLNEVSHGVISEHFPYASLFAIDRSIFLSFTRSTGDLRAALQQLHRGLVREALCPGTFLQYPQPQVRKLNISSSWIELILSLMSFRINYLFALLSAQPCPHCPANSTPLLQ